MESEVNEERKNSKKAKRPIWKSIFKWIGIAISAVIVAAVLFICVVRGITWFSNRIESRDTQRLLQQNIMMVPRFLRCPSIWANIPFISFLLNRRRLRYEEIYLYVVGTVNDICALCVWW